MFYAPHRCVFIHIPRTGGNSVCSAMAASTIGIHDCIVSTAPRFNGPFSRHIRALNLVRVIPEWDSIFKFSVYRPEAEIIESEDRLIKRDILDGKLEDPTVPLGYKDLMLKPKAERYLTGIPDVWKFWCLGTGGEDLGVEKILFNELPDRWFEICEKCKIPFSPLPHLNKGYACP